MTIDSKIKKRDEPNFSHKAAQNIILPGIVFFLHSLHPLFGSKSGLEATPEGSEGGGPKTTFFGNFREALPGLPGALGAPGGPSGGSRVPRGPWAPWARGGTIFPAKGHRGVASLFSRFGGRR